MSDWPVEDLPERWRPFQHGVAQMLFDGRTVAYLATKVIGQGDYEGDVWVQGQHWQIQFSYTRTDPAARLDGSGYFDIPTQGGNYLEKGDVSDATADELLAGAERGEISLRHKPDHPEGGGSTTYGLRWLTGGERETGWTTYGWDDLWP